ncbi:cofilin [Pyrenochaeta sp. DS3sAY3a]|nr:cofilin [Pyrenochaeta sp. DS3sAY3a]
MSIPSGIRIADECIDAVHALRSRRQAAQKVRFVIFKLSDDQQSVVVDDSSSETDYEVFRQKLCSMGDDVSQSPAPPRFAVYDVEYDLGQDGKRSNPVFISWVPANTPVKLCMIYASCNEQIRRALNIGPFIHADSVDEIEWEEVLKKASRGRA